MKCKRCGGNGWVVKMPNQHASTWYAQDCPDCNDLETAQILTRDQLEILIDLAARQSNIDKERIDALAARVKELELENNRMHELGDVFIWGENNPVEYLSEHNRLTAQIARLIEANRWIPCSERLPEIIRKDGEVNVVFAKYKPEYSPDCGSPYSVCNTIYMSCRPELFECWKYTDAEGGK